MNRLLQSIAARIRRPDAALVFLARLSADGMTAGILFALIVVAALANYA
ncbi:MAG: hypothetical protein IT483_15710 [Gammaproteobacteria bacterium]|nr:hypothetical protein [Gammaproteobacteria bacterium]